MAICPHCRAQNVEGTVFCGFCGKELVTPDTRPICPRCGSDRSQSGAYCGKCGAELPPMPKAPKPAEEPPVKEQEPVAPPAEVPAVPAETSAPEPPSSWTVTEPARTYGRSMTACPTCGAPMGIHETYCQSCHYGVMSTDSGVNDRNISDASGLVIAGILLIVVGLMALGTGLLYLLASSYTVETYGASIGCCGSLEFLFGLGALFGGVFAIQRKHFFLALLGAVVGLLTMGPVFLGSILSLVALIMISSGRNEFND